MKVIARCTEGDEVTEVRVPPASFVQYEETHNEALPTAVRSGRTRWFTWLAWHAMTIRHDEKRDFDVWLTAQDDIEDISPEEDAVPTGASRARKSPASPKSPSGQASTPTGSSSSQSTSKKPSPKKR